MAEDRPEKIPLVFFRTAVGSEPVREWLKELQEPERQAIGRVVAGAVALASGHAAVPADGSGAMGNPHGPAHETDSARVALLVWGRSCRAARIY